MMKSLRAISFILLLASSISITYSGSAATPRAQWGVSPWTGNNTRFPACGAEERPYSVEFVPRDNNAIYDQYALSLPKNFDPKKSYPVWIKFLPFFGSRSGIYHDTFAANYCDSNEVIYIGFAARACEGAGEAGGESLGDNPYGMYYGPMIRNDLKELMNEICYLFKVRYFAFAGASMGGYSAFRIAADVPRNYFGVVVASCPAIFWRDDFPVGQWLIEQRVQEGWFNDRLVLLMHGIDDDTVPIADSDRLTSDVKNRQWWNYHRIAGAGHEDFFMIWDPAQETENWGVSPPNVSANPRMVWDCVKEWEDKITSVSAGLLPPMPGWQIPAATDDWYIPQDLVEWAMNPQPTHTPTPTPTMTPTQTQTPTQTATPTPAPPIYLELYGTFHSMGMTVNLDGSLDPDLDATADVEYREESGQFRKGFLLSRIGAGRFVGSLFYLQPDTNYDVQITLRDPDKGVLDGTVVTSTASTRREVGIPAANRTIYVAPNGSDSLPGDGSLSHPFGTLGRALQEAQPGEEVVMRGGIYYEGEIMPPRDGEENAPIIIRNYSGETPILDGADPAAYNWTAKGNGIFQTTLRTSGTHLVLADGKRLYPYQTLDDLTNLRWGIGGFYSSGNELYIRLPNDANPADIPIIISRYEFALEIAGGYFTISGITFRHYGAGEYSKAIYINEGDGNLITDCVFAHNDVGVGIKYDANRNVIQNCEFYDSVFDWEWEAVKDGSNLETGGVYFYDPATGRGNIIRRNVFHDYFDGLHCATESAGADSNETDVYENRFFRCGDDGMEADGRGCNIRIWNNTIADVLSGISLAPVMEGPVYVFRNLICRTGAGNNPYPGLSFKFNNSDGISGSIFLFHNTCHAAKEDTDGLAIYAPGEWANIYSRNNVWAGTRFAISNENTAQPLDFDYDCLWTTMKDELVYWEGLAEPHLVTLEQFRAALGHEIHGINQEPAFAHPASENYAPAAGSPLIDAGQIIQGINDDYSGAAPDIGAFENLNIRTMWIFY